MTTSEARHPSSPVQSPAEPRLREQAWRDIALVVGISVCCFMLSAHFQLDETLFASTRRLEYLQLDELPTGMLALLLGLVWLSRQHYRRARRELDARRIAEASLAGVLTENRKLAQEGLRIQETERKHLARELHDELGQYLNAIKLDAVALCEDRIADPARLAAARGIISSVDHVHGVLGGIIGRLRPVGLDELGLMAAIEHCVDQWRRRLPAAEVSLSAGGSWDDLDESLNLTVYRLIQEGLTNIFKHAQARHVVIALERTGSLPGGGDELRLTLSDDGRGMEPGAPTSRFGLRGMRERVEMAGGRFTLRSGPGRGLSFTATLPVGAERP
jgi:signal transduction histidine kinase